MSIHDRDIDVYSLAQRGCNEDENFTEVVSNLNEEETSINDVTINLILGSASEEELQINDDGERFSTFDHTSNSDSSLQVKKRIVVLNNVALGVSVPH